MIKYKTQKTKYNGRYNPNFKHGKSLKQNNCIDCNKEINWQSSRCQKCAGKARCKPKNRCIDCGIELKNNSTKRCKNCFKDFKKKNKKHNYCIDCNKEISLNAKRCKSCVQVGKKNPEHSKRMIGRKNPMFGNPRFDLQEKFSGKGNPGYIDGRTSLTVMIRGLLEYNNWRKSILKKDDFTCVVCNQYSGHLEVHHKTPFAELLEGFLQEYNQFSPIEDKETLVRLAIKWQPFWDINNGETKCFNCHRFKKHSKDRK